MEKLCAEGVFKPLDMVAERLLRNKKPFSSVYMGDINPDEPKG